MHYSALGFRFGSLPCLSIHSSCCVKTTRIRVWIAFRWQSHKARLAGLEWTGPKILFCRSGSCWLPNWDTHINKRRGNILYLHSRTPCRIHWSFRVYWTNHSRTCPINFAMKTSFRSRCDFWILIFSLNTNWSSHGASPLNNTRGSFCIK